MLVNVANAYSLSATLMDRNQSYQYCASYCNSNLASFHNYHQLTSAIALLNDFQNVNHSEQTSISAWIGLDKGETNNRWSWDDGTAFDFGDNLIQTTNIHNCISLQSANTTCNNPWRTTDCNLKRYAICNSCNGQLNSINELCIQDYWHINAATIPVWDNCNVEFRGNTTIINDYQWYNPEGSLTLEYTFKINTPTRNPTKQPSFLPTNVPTTIPSTAPTPAPSDDPTPAPTSNPTPSPTNHPSPAPSASPTPGPTDDPTFPEPTLAPSVNPTSPSEAPIVGLSLSPTSTPVSSSPTTRGSLTDNPTADPSNNPSQPPTLKPTQPVLPLPCDDPIFGRYNGLPVNLSVDFMDIDGQPITGSADLIFIASIDIPSLSVAFINVGGTY